MDHNKENKIIYFASDFHLGVPSAQESLKREKKLVAWLNMIAKDATDVFLLGDLFDFWFEYKFTIPKGFTRFLGKLAELSDQGIHIHIFTGNHDMWMFDYLEKELGVKIIRQPTDFIFNGKSFHIAHGDGLGPGDYMYKFIKKVFSNKFCQWLFARIHPNLSFRIANYWSNKSRENEGESPKFLGEQKEWLIQYSKELLLNNNYDFFVFGHRHLPIEHQLNTKSTYINLGDWIEFFTYAKFEGEDIALLTYK